MFYFYNFRLEYCLLILEEKNVLQRPLLSTYCLLIYWAIVYIFVYLSVSLILFVSNLAPMDRLSMVYKEKVEFYKHMNK